MAEPEDRTAPGSEPLDDPRPAPALDAIPGPAGAGPGSKPVAVQLLEAQPNPLFTEEQRRSVLFLRFSQAVPCAACGKRSRHHWTMRVSFATVAMDTLVARPSATVHLPLAPVCRAHPLAPAALPARRRRASRAPD